MELYLHTPLAFMALYFYVLPYQMEVNRHLHVMAVLMPVESTSVPGFGELKCCVLCGP